MIAYLTGSALIRPKMGAIRLVGFDMQKTPSGFLSAYLNLRSLITSYAPDVVHSHMVHANLLARLVRLSCRIQRLVCTAHNSNEGRRLRMIGYRLTNFLADVTTNVSAEAVAAFEAIGAVRPGGMLAIHNGIDVERFQPSNSARMRLRSFHGVGDDEKVIIAVGRLTLAKDYSNLLTGFSRLLRSYIKTKLWIIGDGELRQSLELQAAKLNIQERIFFWGIQHNIEEWINAADIFVLSSAWEGFGLVVAEAMACGKVVVATDSGGVKEVLGGCGFLVPTCDEIALSEALNRAISLPDADAKEISVRSRERILCSFSLDSAVKSWLKLYQV